MSTAEATLEIIQAEEAYLKTLVVRGGDETKQAAALRLNARINERRKVEAEIAKEQQEPATAA